MILRSGGFKILKNSEAIPSAIPLLGLCPDASTVLKPSDPKIFMAVITYKFGQPKCYIKVKLLYIHRIIQPLKILKAENILEMSREKCNTQTPKLCRQRHDGNSPPWGHYGDNVCHFFPNFLAS